MFVKASVLALIPLIMARKSHETQSFVAPAPCAVCTSPNYIGQNNGSLPVQPVVPGHVYDRFITVWLENTDFDSAAASATFQKIAEQGILLTNYNAITHPSEPNYVAAMAGDFFGMGDDDEYFLPYNVSTAVDLLESKNISWASYQENMPTAGFDLDFTQTNYLNPSAGNYTYYKRKHNPHIIANSVAGHPDRAKRVRNFNDFAVDVNASALPQHVFVTPNMVNDAHDTDVNFVSQWLEFWLLPLLQNPNFNDNRTLVQLTFDENESYGIQNTIYTVLAGGAVPANLKNTKDSRFYTHYSLLSSIQNNWDLPSLGRQDTNATLASVWDFQANITNHTNYNPQPAEIPLLNLTGIYPGVCSSTQWTPVFAPNITAVGAGNGTVFFNKTATDLNVTSAPEVNLTAAGVINPVLVNPNFTYPWSSGNESVPAAAAAGKPGSAGSLRAVASVGYIVLIGIVAVL